MVVPEPRHTYLRKLIMTAFTGEAIEKLVPRMEAVLSKYLDKWAGERPRRLFHHYQRLSRIGAHIPCGGLAAQAFVCVGARHMKPRGITLPAVRSESMRAPCQQPPLAVQTQPLHPSRLGPPQTPAPSSRPTSSCAR